MTSSFKHVCCSNFSRRINVNSGILKVKSIGIPFGVGPRWEDDCGADGDVNLSFCERASDERSPGIAPCWRHEVSDMPRNSVLETPLIRKGIPVFDNN